MWDELGAIIVKYDLSKDGYLNFMEFVGMFCDTSDDSGMPWVLRVDLRHVPIDLHHILIDLRHVPKVPLFRKIRSSPAGETVRGWVKFQFLICFVCSNEAEDQQ